jgi:hypothetical protein
MNGAGTSEREFSVCQFFEDGSSEYVRRYVSPEEASAVFQFYTNNVSARLGLTKRVIITDGGDCTCAEWEFGKGIVFPLPEDVKGTK